MFYSVVVHMVNNLSEMQETQIWSLSWEDTLEKEMATLSSILAWIIQWTEEPGRLQFMGSQRVGHDLVTKQQHNWFYDLVTKQQLVLWLFYLNI